MNVYAVVFTRSPSGMSLAEHVEGAYPDLYQMTPSTFLVRTAPTTPNQIAKKLEIKVSAEHRRFAGAVFRVSGQHYAGYTARELWAWLDEGDAA